MNKDTTEQTRRVHVCPLWLAYTFDNPIRRMIDPPEKAFGKYLKPGMTVLDIGCGFGHFSIGAARMVGRSGRVIAADLQDKMLEKTMARARKLGLDAVIVPHACEPDRIGLSEHVDFAIAGNVVHEMPDPAAFLKEVFSLLKPGGSLYVTEPRMHVGETDFEKEHEAAREAGFTVIPLKTRFAARRALFTRPTDG